MKVILHYDDCLEDDLRMTVKLTLPKKWVTGQMKRLQDTFVEAYNAKHADDQLDETRVFFQDASGKEIPFDAPVNLVVENGGDLYLRKGTPKSMDELGFVVPEASAEKAPKPAVDMVAARAAADAAAQAKAPVSMPTPSEKATTGSLVCKRFGCNKKFDTSDNEEGCCVHHVKPPVFHETRKFWACCPEKVAWDWDSFTAIPGCSVGKHTHLKNDGQQFLGGHEMRKEQEESTPQRIGEKTPLEKLSALRRALDDIGVSSELFDQARDRLKEHADESSKEVWQAVLEDLRNRLTTALEEVSK